MRIAFTYNLRVSADTSEARYAPQETVTALHAAMRRLGHHVAPIEVSGPVAHTITQLLECDPDLVFNISEGWSGGPGQEFLPGLLMHLGYPHTGSGAAGLMLAIDKNLTKLALREAGVRTPRWQALRDPDSYNPHLAGFPAIIKPNCEGTSRGITQEAVVGNEAAARARIELLLAEFSAGVIVEEYIVGRDVTADFLEAVDNGYGGILDPTEIVIDGAGPGGNRPHDILDYEIKTLRSRLSAASANRVRFRTPPLLPDDVISEIRRMARVSVESIGLADIGTVDFRVARDGTPFVLEVNALPRLDPDLRTHRSGLFKGVSPADDVVAAIISSAVRRYRLATG